jgi:hypothetical protein
VKVKVVGCARSKGKTIRRQHAPSYKDSNYQLPTIG